MAATVALLTLPSAAALPPIGNLVQNPGAEAGAASPDGNTVVPIPSWTTSSNFTVAPYGAPGLPDAAAGAAIGGGAKFFAGGPDTALATATQSVNVADYFTEIDTGNLTATLSGYIGGTAVQEDNGVVEAKFVNGFGLELGKAKIGPVTAGDRNAQTRLLLRSASAPIPPGTRTIRVVMTAARVTGAYNDAFFDNITLTITGPVGRLTPIAGLGGCISRDGTGGNCRVNAALDGAAGLALSPDGRHIYVASYRSDSLVMIDRNPQTGELTQRAGNCWSRSGAGACVKARALNGATGVAVSRDGKNVYVASAVSDGVAIFRRNVNVGRLSQLPGKKGCITDSGSSGKCINGKATEGARSIVVTSPGTNVYVGAYNALAIFKRNLAGELAHLPGKKGCFRARFDRPDRGCRKIVYGNFIGDHSVTLSPNGLNVYTKAAHANSFRRNAATGELTYLRTSLTAGAGYSSPTGAIASPDAKNAYFAGGRGVATFVRQASSQAPVQLDGALGCVGVSAPPCSPGPAAYALAISPAGTNLYAAAAFAIDAANRPVAPFLVQVYARSPVQGALTTMTGAGTCISGVARPFPYCTAVPAISKPSAIAVSPDGKHVYVTDQGSDAIVAFARED